MNAKRFFSCALLALVLLLAGCAGRSVLREGKPYAPGQYAAAAEAAESRFFTVGFRLCQPPEDVPFSQESSAVHYDLVLQNKTDHTLKNVHFTAAPSQKMCDALVSPIWYNENMDIAADGISLCSWDPQIILTRASGPMAEEMREMLIEITWDGGRELLRLRADETSMPEQFLPLLEDLPPLAGTEPSFPQEKYATDQ